MMLLVSLPVGVLYHSISKTHLNLFGSDMEGSCRSRDLVGLITQGIIYIII
jgi:hypothetical protein